MAASTTVEIGLEVGLELLLASAGLLACAAETETPAESRRRPASYGPRTVAAVYRRI